MIVVVANDVPLNGADKVVIGFHVEVGMGVLAMGQSGIG